MNWEIAGALGEILGALAVVASLLYLGTQVRTQNRESRIAAVHEISEAYRVTLGSLHDVDNADLWVKAIDDFDSLSPAERMRFIALTMCIVKVFEEAFYQVQADRFDEHYWQGMLAQYVDFMSTESAKKIWELRGHQFGEEFRLFTENLRDGDYRL